MQDEIPEEKMRKIVQEDMGTTEMPDGQLLEDEDPVEVTVEHDPHELQTLLDQEKERSAEFEDKFKRALADFENLQRHTSTEIQNSIRVRIDAMILDFLQIYDDFVRARDALADSGAATEGLESILKNMDALLQKHDVRPVPAEGQAFDPNLHEAISIIENVDMPNGTITKEIRKGYICKDRVIRPTLVEISKNEGE